MKTRINLKSIIAALVILAVGIFLSLMDVFYWKSSSSIMLNIGCSFIASSLVALVTVFLVEREKISPIEERKIVKIYSTRAERNSEADPNIENARYCIDGIAFGLSTFRTMYGKKIEQCLKKGIQIRLITMDPDGQFISFREEEEKTSSGGIRDTIIDMVEWANELNQNSNKGKIVIKCYKSMTLDYYWRVDDELYVGPYWYGYKSSDTITYKFVAGGRGFQHYSDYFETLWEDNDLCRVLTKVDRIPQKKRKRK